VSQALTPPFLVACLVLCIAGLSKLRAPGTAAAALGLQPWAVRVLAAGELALGAVGALDPTPAGAIAVAVVYSLFATVAIVLMRRRVACGCFGDDDLPVSRAHVIASELLAAMAVAAAFTTPHGIGWVGGQPGITPAALVVGVAGATYAVVLLYTAVPRAWAVWSGE
jgi:Methylamine utilisation protein MauE